MTSNALTIDPRFIKGYILTAYQHILCYFFAKRLWIHVHIYFFCGVVWLDSFAHVPFVLEWLSISSNRWIIGFLKGTTTLGKSGHGSNGNEGVLQSPKISRWSELEPHHQMQFRVILWTPPTFSGEEVLTHCQGFSQWTLSLTDRDDIAFTGTGSLQLTQSSICSS